MIDFAKGALRVLISLSLISYKYGIWSLVFSRGEVLSHFWVSRSAPPWGSCSFPSPRKKDKCSGEMAMVEIDWAIKETLRQKKSRDSRGRVDMGHFLSREVRVELDRQCWTVLNSISGVKNLVTGNTRVPEGSNVSTENDCSW